MLAETKTGPSHFRGSFGAATEAVAKIPSVSTLN